MFKKTLAIVALVGLASTATVSTASAAKNDGYGKRHHNGQNHKFKGHNKGFKDHSRGFRGKFAGWRGVPLPVIRRKLRNRGFYKIRFTDRYLPVYKARACKNGKRFKMRINRWGEVMHRKRIGWCGFNFRGGYRYNY